MKAIPNLSSFHKHDNVLVITSCSKSKAETDLSLPAKELYTGQLFRFVRAYAEVMDFPLYVISAKYGLISSDTGIQRYDKVLKTSADAELLRPQVEEELNKLLPYFDRILVIAGATYRDTLTGVDDNKFVFLKTKGIGYTLQILKKECAESMDYSENAKKEYKKI